MDTQEFRDFLAARAKAERKAAAKAEDPLVAEAHRVKASCFEKQMLEITSSDGQSAN